jgi:hypothetical protein
MTNDISNDAVTYSIQRMKLVDALLNELKDKYTIEGNSYHDLRAAYGILNYQYANAASVISRYIGGVQVERTFIGQANEKQPFTPVPYETQKQAMEGLTKYVFSKDAFQGPSELYNYLQLQRRGYDHYGKNEDPKIHDRVLSIQKGVLDHILHPNVLERILDSEQYGNSYTLSEFMNDLNTAIFKADAKTNVNSFRQNLQVEYTRRLTEILKGGNYINPAKSMALHNLKSIDEMMGNSGDLSTRAHRDYIKYIIEEALDND